MPAARPTPAGSKTAAQHPADGNGTIMRALLLDANRMEKERQRMPASFRKRAFRAQTKSVNPGAARINRNQRQSSLPAAICQALRDCQTRWQGDELRQAAEFRLSKHLKRAREGGSPFAFCRPRGVRVGGGAIFASGTPIFQSKSRFHAVSAPGNPQDFRANWRGWPKAQDSAVSPRAKLPRLRLEI